MATTTIGYNSVGTTGFNFSASSYAAPLGYSLSTQLGTVDKIYAYIKSSTGATCKIIGAVWDSSYNLLGYTNEITFTSTSYAWREMTPTTTIDISPSSYYYVGFVIHPAYGTIVVGGHTSGGQGYANNMYDYPPSDITSKFGDDMHSVYANVTYHTYHADSDTVKLNIGDAWKAVDGALINIGDDWKEVVAMKINIGDTWKDIFPSTPWLGTYAYRRKITINNTNIDSDLTHFPVPIFLGTSVGTGSTDVSDIFDEVGASYLKIAVTKDDAETQLYVEVEKWDDTGETAVLWISKSDWIVDADADTEIYIYFDSAQSDNSTYVGVVGSRTEVWNSGYAGVWHMDQVSIVDSTSNNNDKTAGTDADLISAKVGDGLDFEYSNSDKYAVAENGSLDLTTAITCQCWFKQEAMNDYVRFISKQYNGVTTPTSCYQLGMEYSSRKARWSVGGVFDIINAYTFSNGTWYFFAGTYDKTNTEMYVNTTNIASSTSYTSNIRTSNHNLSIGSQYYNSSFQQYQFDGVIDEVRVSNVARSADWLKADYYAQTDALVSFASTETL